MTSTSSPSLPLSPRESDTLWSQRWCWMAAAGVVALVVVVWKAPFVGLAQAYNLGRLLLVAPFVLLPLGMSMLARSDRGGRHSLCFKAAFVWHPFALVGLVGALCLKAPVAPILAAMWLLQTMLFAGFGLSRFAWHGFVALEEVGLSMSLVYLPVGGAWLVVHTLGWTLGFSPIIVLLTVLHFHYAGFAASFVTGMSGRVLPEQGQARRWYRFGGTLVVLCPLLVALGISFSPLLEVITAMLLACGMLVVAGLMVFVIVPSVSSWLAKGGMVVAALSLSVTMALAVTYALGEYLKADWISIARMGQYHGLLNVLGYATCGIVAWFLVRPPSRFGREGR